ncbi:MAG: 2OG-Fe(II) oxygenase [Burkholderiales bacterium]|nr:2OG-Fe(II) oxygenase [Burkholderiales bacterium]
MSAYSTQQKFSYLFPESVAAGAGGAVSLQWAATVGNPFEAERALAFNDALPTLQLLRGVFDPAECGAIIALGNGLDGTAGRVEIGADTYRVSKIVWIEPGEATHWIYHRLGVMFAQANRHYGLELTGLVEALQYTVYGPGQHFDWHIDLGSGQTSARKLSMTVQLSDAGEYSGGALEFINAPSPDTAREIGSATVFPSYLAHRVAPVQTGVRRSLVAWAYGPAFK